MRNIRRLWQLTQHRSLEANNESCLYFVRNNLASSPHIIVFEAYRRIRKYHMNTNMVWVPTLYTILCTLRRYDQFNIDVCCSAITFLQLNTYLLKNTTAL